MKFEISLFIVLALTWAGLSGETSALIISFGFLSCLLVTYIVRQMNHRDGDWHPFDFIWRRLPGYTVWLCGEILKSNIDVAKAILLRPDSIRPARLIVDASSLSELGQVMYANSITLTPGTVSLFLRDGKIEVHALLEDAAKSLESGTMLARVEHLSDTNSDTDGDPREQPGQRDDTVKP